MKVKKKYCKIEIRNFKTLKFLQLNIDFFHVYATK